MATIAEQVPSTPWSNGIKNDEKEQADLAPSDTIPAAGGDEPIPIDPAVMQRALRRIDWYLMPAMLLGYGFVVYDKAILGSATLFGMLQDLELKVGTSTARLSLATSLFYIGQLAGSYPMAFLVQKFGARWTVGPAVIIWAIIAASTAACTNYKGLYAQRFFLGFTESIIPTAFTTIVAGFYTQSEQSYRQLFWFSGAGWFTAIGSALNYGFSRIEGKVLHSWQYCYVFAGLLTFLFGIWCFFLPDSPSHAWFLSPEERVAAVERLRKGQTGIKTSSIKWYQIKEALSDYKVWLVFIMMASGYSANGAVTGFGPLIVSTFGYSTLDSILFQFPIGIISATSGLITGLAGARWRNVRFPLLLACTLPTIAGYIIIWKSAWDNHPVAPVVGYSLVGFFGAVVGLVIPIASSNVAGQTKKSFISAAVFVGYCVGNIVGPQLVKSQEKDQHYPTLWAGLTGIYGITIVSTSTLWYLLWKENKRRATLNLDPAEADKLGFHDLTDKENLHFRYVL
ncbi:putative MFS transporter [Xylariaceae sp. FL0255]|nr:putative MFS transporter [Xylariaceae sp. FL0255]